MVNGVNQHRSQLEYLKYQKIEQPELKKNCPEKAAEYKNSEIEIKDKLMLSKEALKAQEKIKYSKIVLNMPDIDTNKISDITAKLGAGSYITDDVLYKTADNILAVYKQ